MKLYKFFHEPGGWCLKTGYVFEVEGNKVVVVRECLGQFASQEYREGKGWEDTPEKARNSMLNQFDEDKARARDRLLSDLVRAEKIAFDIE